LHFEERLTAEGAPLQESASQGSSAVSANQNGFL
jgi:hypothetical protein